MEKIKIGQWNAIIHFDDEENIYTVSYDGEGGAIVSDSDPIKAENKFIEAMNLAESVQKILSFYNSRNK